MAKQTDESPPTKSTMPEPQTDWEKQQQSKSSDAQKTSSFHHPSNPSAIRPLLPFLWVWPGLETRLPKIK